MFRFLLFVADFLSLLFLVTFVMVHGVGVRVRVRGGVGVRVRGGVGVGVRLLWVSRVWISSLSIAATAIAVLLS